MKNIWLDKAKNNKKYHSTEGIFKTLRIPKIKKVFPKIT